jgi:hypothetical protein
MRAFLSGGLGLALLAGVGLSACNDDQNAAVPPVDEPAATGSITAEDPTMPPADDTIPPADAESALPPAETDTGEAPPPQ